MPLKWYFNLSLWNVRALRRFLYKMQTNVYWTLGESFLFNLCGNCGLWKNALVESDTYISLESADSLIKYNKCLWDAGWKLSVPSRWRVLAFRKCLNTMPLKWCFYFCGKCGISEESLIKCKQMSMRGWKLSVKSLWKLRALKKCLGGKWYFYLSLWKVQTLEKRISGKWYFYLWGK